MRALERQDSAPFTCSALEATVSRIQSIVNGLKYRPIRRGGSLNVNGPGSFRRGRFLSSRCRWFLAGVGAAQCFPERAAPFGKVHADFDRPPR